MGVVFGVFVCVEEERGIHAGVVSWYLRSLTATVLFVYYHVSMVQGESFSIHVLHSRGLCSLCVEGTILGVSGVVLS